MKNGMTAIIKKDLREIVSNRRMFASLLIVPLVLTVFMPSVFVLAVHFAPEDSSDFESLLKLLPVSEQTGDFQQLVIGMLIHYILPLFFLIVPIMAASIMAASSFAGEKERHTLETLLYSPLSLKQIFRAKVLASFLLSMIVSLISFAVMLLVLETEMILTVGSFLAPGINWLLVMALVSPAISMISITLTVRISVKAKSMEDAQQAAVFLLIPVILLLVGQFVGVLLINAWILLLLGIVFALLAWLLMKRAMRSFSYEKFLK